MAKGLEISSVIRVGVGAEGQVYVIWEGGGQRDERGCGGYGLPFVTDEGVMEEEEEEEEGREIPVNLCRLRLSPFHRGAACRTRMRWKKRSARCFDDRFLERGFKAQGRGRWIMWSWPFTL